MQTRGRDPRAGRRATGGRGRRGDVRVRAVVDVEHRGLRALEEHAVAIVDPAREQQGGVGDVGCEPAGVAEVLVEDLLHREGLRVIDLAQEPILLRDVQLEFLAEEPLVEEIGHADPRARRLVHVGGSDALTGGADPPLAELRLGGAVERRVVGHDQVRVLRDEEVAVERDTSLHERLHLLDKRPRVHDDAAADDAAAAGVEDAGGDRVQDVLLTPDDHRVAGVVAAGEPRDDVDVGREEVDDLPLALVPPLRADDHDVRHGPHPQRSAPAPPGPPARPGRARSRPRDRARGARRASCAGSRRPGRGARAERARRRPTPRARG